MQLERSSGVLLHITSLPGEMGIGTLGDEAYRFADLLKRGGFKYWQLLPVGPVSPAHGFSPYASPSTFAGNFMFVSLEKLARESWFSARLSNNNFKEKSFIDFNKITSFKIPVLQYACADFFNRAAKNELSRFERFCNDSDYWLDDYALFASLSEYFNTNNWLKWEKSLAFRDKSAILNAKNRLSENIRFHKFIQYVFTDQFIKLKEYCNSIGIKLIGDIPIYVSMDSADTWASPSLFQLNEKTWQPEIVSGVPPDYFSKTGQRWGNPIYKWFDTGKKVNEKVTSWWIKRISRLSCFADIIRIDHFRGFESYWAIPAEEKTAVKGEWIKGPGIEFFNIIKKSLHKLNLIAEDLGIITPEVEKLRDDLGLPGMKILQFAFDFNNKNSYLPHNIRNQNCILYTGTHDNNTTNGWFYGAEIDDSARRYILEYMGSTNYSDLHWQLIRLAYMSVANLVILPAQDILGFGEEFRMNIPGTVNGNWNWKLTKDSLTNGHIEKIRSMAIMYNRIPDKK